MVEKPLSWTPVIIVAIIVVVASSAAGAYLYIVVNAPKSAPSVLTVQEGDNVTVNYIGSFGSGIDHGKVFDTSLLNVAKDNASYPKAISFGFRGDKGYTPLPAHVGPQSYGNYTSLITGFWTAMVGLKANQTITTVILPAQGYGNANPAKVVNFSLVQTLPMVTTYTPNQFGTSFSGIAAQTGAVFTDPHYQWQDEILSENSTAIVVEYLPTVGQVVHPYGWPILITNVSNTNSPTGTITFQNELTSQDVGKWKGTDWANNQPFFLSAVNVQAGTYTLDFNQEVQGNTLIFQITVFQILPPAAA